MAIRAQDLVPVRGAGARLIELAAEVAAGAEEVSTKNGAAYVAIVEAKKLNYYHALEAEYGRLILLGDTQKSIEDALAGKVMSEDECCKQFRRRRKI